MSDNYIAVLYYAFHEKYAKDIVAFHDFLCDNVHSDGDLMTLLTECDLTGVQIRAIQLAFSLSRKILLKCKDKLDWSLVGSVEYRDFDDATVNKLKDYVSWSSVFSYSKGVSEKVLMEHVDEVSFSLISKCRIWSDAWLWRFRGRMHWFDVTINSIETGRINDEFLGKFSQRVDWLMISRYGDECLTTELIEKYADFLDWNELSVSRHWTDDEKKRFANRINFDRVMMRDMTEKELGLLCRA